MTLIFKKTLLTLLSSAALAAASSPVIAQDNYPSKPIKLLVGFAAGGPTDIIARVIAKDMSVSLGQTVFVDNKAGASSMIATREVKSAAPDGYTLLFSSLGMNVNPILLGDQAGYNPKTDFAPISNAATLPLVAVNAYDSPIKSMSDLLKKARSKPEAVSFASSGSGGSGHLASELLATQAKSQDAACALQGQRPGPAGSHGWPGRLHVLSHHRDCRKCDIQTLEDPGGRHIQASTSVSGCADHVRGRLSGL